MWGILKSILRSHKTLFLFIFGTGNNVRNANLKVWNSFMMSKLGIVLNYFVKEWKSLEELSEICNFLMDLELASEKKFLDCALLKNYVIFGQRLLKNWWWSDNHLIFVVRTWNSFNKCLPKFFSHVFRPIYLLNPNSDSS